MLTPRVTTISLPGGITQTTDTSTVSTTLIPFIRSRKVFFKIEGLLPNMAHTPFFDGVDVSDWCREEAFQFAGSLDEDLSGDETETAFLTGHPETSSALISNANGEIEGSFFLPNTSSIRFRTGAREFKVRDAAATTDENAISSAFSTYTAQGTLETQNTVVTTIRPQPAPQPTRWIDPIAQSFLVERETGMYVTSVDVFFRSAAASGGLPIRCQIRPVVNGVPTNTPVPGAEKMLAAADVNTTVDPNSPSGRAARTKFTFDAPIYLDAFGEYAVVIITESVDYEVWTAAVTEFIEGSTTRRVMQQPTLGSFFKSQNGSTWTADQSRDLMFRVNRAQFNIGSATEAIFENLVLPKFPLTTDPITVETVGASPTIRVALPNHGLTNGSTLVINGLSAVGGITAAELNFPVQHTVVSAEDIDSVTVQVSGATSTSTTTGGGSNGFARGQHQYDILYPNVNQLEHPNATAAWSMKTTTGASPSQLETEYQKDGSYVSMLINKNNEMGAPRVVAAGINETNNLSGERSLQMRAQLTSASDYVAPVIDLSRLSASLIRYRIDNQESTDSGLDGYNVPDVYVAETDSDSGTALAKHIFIPITLTEEAVGLKVLFAAHRPVEAFIDLYYRTAASGDDVDLSEVDWTLATIDQAMPGDDNPAVFREYEYTIPNDGTDLTPFTRYQYKIVFRSSSTSKVPRLTDFRSIALST